MKIAIIHLSDIHADSDWNWENDVNEISKQFENLEVKKAIIAISGDLTQSGAEHQFEIVYDFIQQLSESIYNFGCKADVVFVPGNHDIQYDDGEKRQRAVLSTMDDSSYFNNLDVELKRFTNYYSFSELFDLPTNFIDEKVLKIAHKDFEIEQNLKIRFYLLNNVVYSTYKAKNNENSCGVVRIPRSLLDPIILEPNTINILLMHFPPYYFDETTYGYLRSKMPLLSYILCGHVHQGENVRITSGDYLCSVSISPALHKEVINRLGMSFLLFDTDSKIIEKYSYGVSDRKMYIKNSGVDYSSIRLISGKNPIMKKTDFYNSLLYSGYEKIPLCDYFVFPELFSDKTNTYKKILDLKTFIYCLSKKHTIVIKGASQSGKTTLINKLFFDLDEIGVPVILDAKYFREFSDEILLEHVKSALEKEYDDKFAYDIFINLPKDERVVLLDNFIIDSNSKKTLSVLSNVFGKIVVLSSGTNYGATQIENVAMQSILDDSVAFYDLQPMFKQKRYELVQKRFHFFSKETGRPIDENAVKILYEKVEMILDKYVGSDANYPYFINKVIATVMDDNSGLSTQNNRMYSKVYEIYINTIILDVFQNQEKALIANELLKIIANSIINNDSYHLEYETFHKLINAFFTSKRLKGIDSDELVQKMLEKKIIIKTDDNYYAFGSFDFLSYFAACYFSNLLNDDFDTNKLTIIDYLNNNYDDVISKFLLFVVSLANKKTALFLIDLAEEFVSAYDDYEVVNEELALNDKEFSYLHQLTKKDKQTLREKISEKEAEKYNKEKEEYKKSVDDKKGVPDNDEIKLICKCMGLLDIVSAMLPDLKVVIDGVDQDRCIKLLYKLPVILYRLDTGYLSDNYKELSVKLVEILKNHDKDISIDTAKSIIIDYCRATFLAFTDHTFRRAHSSITEDDLRRKEFVQNDTHRIMRLMSSLHDDNAEETFEKYAKDYFLYFKANPFARNCISLMVRNYVSWYLSEEKALTKKEFLRLFLKDERVVSKTIEANLKDNERPNF